MRITEGRLRKIIRQIIKENDELYKYGSGTSSEVRYMIAVADCAKAYIENPESFMYDPRYASEQFYLDYMEAELGRDVDQFAADVMAEIRKSNV